MNAKIPQFQIPLWLTPHVAEVRIWPAVKGDAPCCRVSACGRDVRSLGLCVRHYNAFRTRALREGLSLAEWLSGHAAEVVGAPAVVAPEAVCWVAACGRSALHNGLCRAHYRLARHHFHTKPVVGPASDSEAAL